MADAPADRQPGGIIGAATHKYGPLPAWAWAGIAGGAAFLYIRHRDAATGSTSDDTSDTDTGDDTEASDLASDEASDLAGDFPPPADTASPAVYSGPGSSAKDPIYVDTRNTAPTGSPSKRLRVVTVGKGDDSVAKFMARYGVSLAQLRHDNPGRHWRAHERLKPGTKVHVPAKGK
jgi:hypothetical protein